MDAEKRARIAAVTEAIERDIDTEIVAFSESNPDPALAVIIAKMAAAVFTLARLVRMLSEED